MVLDEQDTDFPNQEGAMYLDPEDDQGSLNLNDTGDETDVDSMMMVSFGMLYLYLLPFMLLGRQPLLTEIATQKDQGANPTIVSIFSRQKCKLNDEYFD